MDEPFESWQDKAKKLLESESPPTLVVYMAFSEASDALTDQLAEIAALTSEIRMTQLGFETGRAYALGKLFADYARAIFVERGTDASAVQEIVDLYMQDNTERIIMMEKLVGIEADAKFPKNRAENIRELFDDLIEEISDIEEVCDVVSHMYATDLLSDIKRYFEGLIEKQAVLHPDDLPKLESEDESMYSVRSQLGRHAIDIGKVAAGTLIALLINGAVQRKKFGR
ncbi:hypothetical protein KA093_01625 [Candidatus Saccharibacteria bacterium]|nr:hypothetical protein [Candidatus Saccharibacteria bacterium]